MTLLLVWFVLGIALLIYGADILVKGATGLAAALGVSPLVIGLTVVSFGTSSPELAVGLKAELLGSSPVALGNVVGSNICNSLLILGLAALFTPVFVSRGVIRRDIPVMIGVSFLPLLLGFNGTISRAAGLLLFSLFLAHTYWIVRSGRREIAAERKTAAENGVYVPVADDPHWVRNAFLVIAGLGLLLLGSRWVVTSAVDFAGRLGISELTIGLTVIAVGTSLPEVAASVAAAYRGRPDIAVGNVVGSNLFNIMVVLGVVGAISPDGFPVDSTALHVDLPIMIAASVACLPICFTGGRVDRWEGGLFIICYAAYITYHILRARGHELLPLYVTVIPAVLIVLTVIVLARSVMRSGRS